MRNFLLNKVRLSWYFLFFFCAYLTLAFTLSRTTFDSAALTLFSVNSFLYGFYLAPILSAQKMRIEDLHRTVRAEANAIFSMALTMKKLPKATRNRLQGELAQYVLVSSNKGTVMHAENEYEDMITYCLEYKGKDTAIVEKILNSLIDNQKNRTQFMMQVSNKVYSNEWMIILMLFSITVGFVLMLDIKGSILLVFIKALLCTGLTMLLVIIVKLSTLTHKKAKEIWNPFRKLSETNFYRID